MSNNDLTDLRHLNEHPPADAVWWECAVCGDYAWVWPGETAPDHEGQHAFTIQIHDGLPAGGNSGTLLREEEVEAEDPEEAIEIAKEMAADDGDSGSYDSSDTITWIVSDADGDEVGRGAYTPEDE